jgi:hypothetical protein
MWEGVIEAPEDSHIAGKTTKLLCATNDVEKVEVTTES